LKVIATTLIQSVWRGYYIRHIFLPDLDPSTDSELNPDMSSTSTFVPSYLRKPIACIDLDTHLHPVVALRQIRKCARVRVRNQDKAYKLQMIYSRYQAKLGFHLWKIYIANIKEIQNTHSRYVVCCELIV